MIEGNEILSKIFIELAPESFVSRMVVSLTHPVYNLNVIIYCSQALNKTSLSRLTSW